MMKEFLVVIHRDLTGKRPVPTPEQLKEVLQPYQEWIMGIAKHGKLVGAPQRWDADGRVITQSGPVLYGPYTEKHNSVGGLFLIKAKDYDEAVEIAKGCPIIQYGAIVEVRMAIPAA
jgi:hypothetical protein